MAYVIKERRRTSCPCACPSAAQVTPGAALRAAEIGAQIMMKATMVDGVYDKDPHKYDDAVKYDTLTFSEVLNKELAVMDMTAASMCKDNHIPVLVFDIGQPDNLVRAVQGEDIGTLVTEG